MHYPDIVQPTGTTKLVHHELVWRMFCNITLCNSCLTTSPPSGFCNCCSPIKQLTLRNRGYASSLILLLKKEFLRLAKCSKKAFHDYHHYHAQTSKWFACFKVAILGLKTSYAEVTHHEVGLMEVWKKCMKSSIFHMTNNVCNILNLPYTICQCILTKIETRGGLWKNVCPICWIITRNKTDFMC